MSEHSELGSFGETAGIRAGFPAVSPKLHFHARIQRDARVRVGVEVSA
ncbi:hypothetical protein [Catellatospora paridis]|nr:hypothetical protein [Catellatospora paridis]